MQRVTIRILLIVSVWLVAVWVVGAARHFLFLILLAWLAAIASEPAIGWLVRRGWRRGRATALVGASVILVSLGLVFLFGRLLYDQATQLVQSAPARLQSIADQLNSTFGLQLDPVRDHLVAADRSRRRSVTSPTISPSACWGGSALCCR